MKDCSRLLEFWPPQYFEYPLFPSLTDTENPRRRRVGCSTCERVKSFVLLTLSADDRAPSLRVNHRHLWNASASNGEAKLLPDVSDTLPHSSTPRD